MPLKGPSNEPRELQSETEPKLSHRQKVNIGVREDYPNSPPENPEIADPESPAFRGFNIEEEESVNPLSNISLLLDVDSDQDIDTKPTIMDAIKQDWDLKKPDFTKYTDELDEALDEFEDVLDTYSRDGRMPPVDNQWAVCRDKFNLVRTAEKHVLKYDSLAMSSTTNNDEKRAAAQIKQLIDAINNIKSRYQTQNTTYRITASDARSRDEAKGSTKKEEVEIPSFDPDTSDWEDWSTLIHNEISRYTNDELKKNFLLKKVDRPTKALLVNHRTYDDCMETLKGTYGDALKVNNERINAFVKWAQEPVSSLLKTEKISEDVAKLSGLAARLVHPRDKACKCINKRSCTQAGHKLNDHCALHCEYDVLKEDTDKLHSILMAIAGNRLPTAIVESVGIRARQTEKDNKRSLDVKQYVDLLTEHVNNMKIARSTFSTTPIPNRDQNSNLQPGTRPYQRPGPRTELGVVGNEQNFWRNQPSYPPTRGTQYGSQRGWNQQNRSQVTCFYCTKNHRITWCPTAKLDDPRNVLQRIKAANACTICFAPNHQARDCPRPKDQNCTYCVEKNLSGWNTHQFVVCPRKPKLEHVAMGAEMAEDLPPEFYD